MEDFRAPQLFNVEIGPDVGAQPQRGVVGPSIPPQPQEITRDLNLYSQPENGMRQGVIR